MVEPNDRAGKIAYHIIFWPKIILIFKFDMAIIVYMVLTVISGIFTWPVIIPLLIVSRLSAKLAILKGDKGECNS